MKSAEEMDSFNYVSKDLGISISTIVQHLYEQDLAGNIKKLPAMKKDVYFEVLIIRLEKSLSEKIIDEINAEIAFKIERLNELKELFNCSNPTERITELLS